MAPYCRIYFCVVATICSLQFGPSTARNTALSASRPTTTATPIRPVTGLGSVSSTTTTMTSTTTSRPTSTRISTKFSPRITPLVTTRRTSTTTEKTMSRQTWHSQVMFANDYETTLNASRDDVTRRQYASQFEKIIADKCDVDPARIADASVHEHPTSGHVVLRFDVLPALSPCKRGCLIETPRVVDNLETLVDSFSFNLTDDRDQVLYVDQLPAFFGWTDAGPCPNVSCDPGHVCDVHMTGDYYCKCTTADCSSRPDASSESDGGNDQLWALFVIPLVLIIVLVFILALLARQRYKKHPEKRKPAGRTVRNYQAPYDIGTIFEKSEIPSVDPGATNRLYRTLGSTLGVAFNDRSFNEYGDTTQGNQCSSAETGVAPF